MRMKVKDLKGSSVLARFGPESDPEKFEIDLLEVARRSLSLKTINDFDELELEIGHRLGERPYPDTGRARGGMPSHYLCEGSVWVNFYSLDGKSANVSLVPHLHETGYRRSEPPHHNFWLFWTNFDGSIGSNRDIPGHVVSKDESTVISLTCGKEIRKGIIEVKPSRAHRGESC